MRPLTLALPLLILVGGCRKAEQAHPQDAGAKAANPDAHGRAGAQIALPGPPDEGTNHVDVIVTLAGKPPEMALTKRDGDPYCKQTPMKDEGVVVNYGDRLSNVLVRLTKGVKGDYPALGFDAVLDQAACTYRPRVLGMMAGQTLVVRNSDQTLHNVHTYKGASTVFNKAIIPGLPPLKETLEDAAGEIVKVKCDVHPWMTAYIAVMNHPFFAVTGQSGSIRLPSVPYGKYTLESWHERYGTQSQEITVAPGAAIAVTFQYRAAN